MKFEQFLIDDTVRFFEKNFMERWGFKKYYDKNKPAVFFGIRNLPNKYENHKSYKIIIPTTPTDLPDFTHLKNNDKTILVYNRELNPEYYIPENVVVKNEIIPFKDFSLFQPNIMGDKIYYYSGFKEGWGEPWKKDLISEIQKNIDYEIITTSHNKISDYNNIETLKEKFYDKCFLNLNLSESNGMTTVQEMGLMGRKTIVMRKKPLFYNYDCILNCSSFEEIIKTINIESKKIGTIQPKSKIFTVNDEWLNLSYWI